MNKSIRRGACRPLVLAIAVGLGIGSAHAANITVNAGDDAGSSTTCTLRQAIESANTDSVVGNCLAGSGTDSIDFGSLTSATITLANGQLEVDGDLTINGSGQTIDANGTSRVLYVGPSASLTASSLTLTGGSTSNRGGGIYVYGDSSAHGFLTLASVFVLDNYSDNEGGGIFLGDHAPLSVSASTISGNTSNSSGAGIYVWGYSNIDIADSTISGNVSGGDGGGLYAFGTSLTLTGSIISGNTSDGNGGGVFLSYKSVATITDSTISDNTSNSTGDGPYAGGGGGLYLAKLSTATITGSTISGNTAQDDGGGIFAYWASMEIASSTVSNNSAASYGGGVHLAGIRDGGSNTLTLRDTTVSGNQATYGGGISAQTKYDYDYSGGTATLTPSNNTISFVNATVTGNSATSVGGGVGLFANNYVENTAALTAGSSLTTLDIVSSTVSGNQSGGSAGGVYAGIQPGSLGARITVSVSNTIFSANTTNGGFDDLGLVNAGATFGAQGSLLGSALESGNSGNGNIFFDAPGLGALANNGGPTLTMTLLPGSPAIDAGDNSLVPAGVINDQRGAGFARISNGTIDIGAIELVAAIVAPIATNTVPVPARSPWALGLLGVLLAALGLGTQQRRRRRQS